MPSYLVLFGMLLMYLISVPIVLSSIGATYGESLPYDSQTIELQGTFLGNIATGVSILPWYINTILILIPFVMVILLSVLYAREVIFGQ